MDRGPEDDSAAGTAPGPLPSGRAPESPGLAEPAGFADGGRWDSAAPSAALAVALEATSGKGSRYAGASHDELLGVLHQWQALEAWSAAGKLGALRALIGQDGPVLSGVSHGHGAPEGWPRSLTHEVALALSMPVVSAEHLMWFAHDLHTRFGGIGELLAAGDLTFAKARAVCEPLALLSDEDAAAA